MGQSRPLKAGYSSMRLIAKRLREDIAQDTHEPLPERWVELIHYLNELERKHQER